MSLATGCVESKLKLSLHDKIWNFDVSDPRLHPEGFTIYKVTCRFFSIERPESLTVVVTWKRYNDFKNLHKQMVTLHHALHRRDAFPLFAKPKVFGRFDDAVVEERRQSALALLNFIGTQPHLYKSQALAQFLADGRVDSVKPKLLSPISATSGGRDASMDILTPLTSTEGLAPAAVSPSAGSWAPSGGEKLSKASDIDFPEAVSSGDAESSLQCSLDVSGLKPLEGTWNFPQVPDSISLGSSTGDDDTDAGDMDSLLSSSLPDASLAIFDPLASPTGHSEIATTNIATTGSIPCTNSWLTQAISTCAHMDDVQVAAPVVGSAVRSSNGSIDSSDLASFDPLSASYESRHSQNARDISIGASKRSPVEVGWGEENFIPPEVTIRQERSNSGVSCGKGDLDLSGIGEGRRHSGSSASTSSSCLSALSQSGKTAPLNPNRPPPSLSPSQSRRVPQTLGGGPALATPAGSPGHSPAKGRSPTTGSVSTMDLGGKEDYIYTAAGQICLAQNSEATGQYQLAFNYYKTGVGILLQGVQGDSNKARRDAVRRKTAQYLMKAEDLYNCHLAVEKLDERRWAADCYVSPSLDLDPSFAFIRGSSRELKNYQVLGAVDKNVLVLDRSTEETFVIKTVQKMATGALLTATSSDSGCSGQRTVLPTTCPYMVSLIRFFETDSAIYLLLQYASGGRLWAYIASYLHQNYGSSHNIAGDAQTHGASMASKNIYMGQKMHTSCNTLTEQEKAAIAEAEKATQLKKEAFLSEAGVRFSELRAAVISPDADIDFSLNTENGINDRRKQVTDKGEEMGMEDKTSPGTEPGVLQNINTLVVAENRSTLTETSPDPRRLSSLSSDECFRSLSQEDSHACEDSPEVTSKRDSQGFHDLLQGQAVALENFSINSFDSDTARLSLSLSEPPEMEATSPSVSYSPRDPLTTIPDEVFSEQGLPSVPPPLLQNVHSSEVTNILENSRQLLRTVERTLSHLEAEDGPASVQDQKTQSAADKYSKDNSSSSSPEVSIYDSHRHSDNSSGDIMTSSIGALVFDSPCKSVSSKCQYAAHENGFSKSTDELDGQKFDSVCNSRSESLDITTGFSDNKITNTDSQTSDSGAVNQSSNSERHTSFSTKQSSLESSKPRATSTTSQRSDIPVLSRKISFTRTVSGEMTRSASFEHDLKSPTRHRGRALSEMFEQLDGECAENVVLPEAVVQRWAAEIVIAVSRLHALGIICKDLKPDNVLLGEGGHIFLTYFYQLRQLEKEIDWGAVEHMYVAPEVRSISGFDASCDWWSVGALLYELLVGRSLLSTHPGGILPYTPIYIPNYISHEGRSLLQELLRYNPRERLGAGLAGAEEIKAHNFFHGIDWHSLEYV